MSDELRDHGWADATNSPDLDAISLTLIQPVGRPYVEALRPREVIGRSLTIAQALEASLEVEDLGWGSCVAQTDVIDGWSVILEPNGWVTSLPEVVARLSDEGRAINLFWNVNAVMSFCVADLGVVLRAFDPLLYDDSDPLPEELDLPFGQPEIVRAASLALIARLTGVRVERSWLLERARPTYLIPAPGSTD